MKRLIIGIIFIVISFTVSVSSYFCVKNVCNGLYGSLSQTEYSADKSTDTALKNASLAIKEWQSKKIILSFFVTHDRTDKLDKSFARLDYCVRNKDTSEIKKLCSEIKAQLEIISDSQTPDLKEVF